MRPEVLKPQVSSLKPRRGVFAQLTPPGEGGIAAFGVEGPGARAALARAVRSKRLADLAPGELAYGRLLDARGAVLDEVIVAALAPRGDVERFELDCHAGGAAAAAAAERLAGLGLARQEKLAPEPGLAPIEREFRAALAGVRTRRQLAALSAARRELPGALRRAGEMLSAPGGCEAAADALGGIVEETRRLAALLAGHRVVLAGPAGAGKSTLFNVLVGRDRAITSPHPGTTRDAVVAEVSLGGLWARLADTAGLGDGARGEMAVRSREMTRRRARGAGLLLLVLDGSRPPDRVQRAETRSLARAAAAPLLAVLNKSDLPPSEEARRLAAEVAPGGVLETCALSGAGAGALLAALEAALLPEPPAGRAAAFGPAAGKALEQAFTCARRAAVENDPEVAAQAARILTAALE